MKLTKITILLVLLLPLILGFVSANNETNSTEPVVQNLEPEPEIEQPTLQIKLDKDNIEVNEDAELDIIINPNDRAVSKIRIDWGDNDDNEYSISLSAGDEFYFETKKHSYNNEGDYDITVKIYCGSEECDSETETIDVEEIEIPDENPEVNLIYPKNKAEIKADKVTFKFSVDDDNKIDNCEFELYKKEGTWKELDYSQTIDEPEMNKELLISLQDFEDANYSWYITCEDNNSQEDSDDRSFSIQTTSHEREKEIEALLEDLNTFLEKEDSMGLEEKEAMDELEIIKDLKYYKKRLIQINQDLGNNIKFISDKTLREKRKLETNEELDEIKEKIPKDLEVVASEEYITNIQTNSLTDIITKYLNAKNIFLKEREIKKLTNYNLGLQEKITVSTEIKKIEIEYANSVETLSIVKKDLRINDQNYKRFLEAFPEDLKEDIEFLTKAGEVTNNLYEINLDDLDENKIIYHVKGDVSVNKLKAVDSIIFDENIKSSSLITGMAVFDGGFSDSSIYIGLAVLVFILSGFIGFPKFKKGKLNKWKNNDNARKTVAWLRQANTAIKEKQIDIAKEKYHKIKEIYLLLPEDFKQVAYEKIEEVRIEIDKTEIKELMKEFIKLKKEGNSNHASKLYNQIKEKYTRLPKKYQQKVYDKLISLA